MTHKIQDLNRRNLSFSRSKVREVLPEYFAESYPNLVLFLEKYYEYLEGENADAFKREINNLFVARDPEQVDEEKLDYLLQEIGNGLKSSTFFDKPRLMTSLLSRFYRVKGSLSSVEGFFRGFFGEEVNIEYPKNQMFIVGESEVGYESLKFIQDNKLYQIFSILIKTAVPTSVYRDLYIKFVHPAGFYFAGQVQLESPSIFGLQSFSQENLRESAQDLTLSSSAVFGVVYQPTQLTALYDSSGGKFRASLDDYIEAYKDMTSTQLTNVYGTLARLVSPNSFTFDDFGETSYLVSYNADSNNDSNQRPIIQDDGASYSVYQPPDSNYLYVEDSAGATNQYSIGGSWTYIFQNKSSGAGIQIRWKGGSVYLIDQYFSNTVDSVQSGDLFFNPAYPLNVFRADELKLETISGSLNTAWSVSKLVIDSDGNAVGDGPDMSLIVETMDNDMYTVYQDSFGDSFY